MLLAIDIGNTSISFGVFEGDKLKKTFRLSSHRKFSVYQKLLKSAINRNKILPKDIDGIIICSVVPGLIPIMEKAARKIFFLKPFIVGKNIKAPIKNNYRNPKQVGHDRLVDAVAAREIYGLPIVVVDSGTAITFDFVSEKGEYEGGIIVPGVDISLKALYERTALLPDVKLKDDKGLKLIGKDTANSIKSGILHGFGSLTDGVINRLKSEYGKDLIVVGTGGYIDLIKKYSNSIDIIDECLTLKGLNIMYDNIQKDKKDPST